MAPDLEETLSGLIEPMPDRIRGVVDLGIGLADGYDLFDSPLGTVLVTFNVRGVRGVTLAGEEAVGALGDRQILRAAAPRSWGDGIARAIEQGNPDGLPLDLDRLTDFQRSVLGITASIPRGQVRPYGWLAAEAGRPGAARAVGSVMARNPVPLIVPCHRVVRSDGTLGEYSLGDTSNKRLLLEREGASWWSPAGGGGSM